MADLSELRAHLDDVDQRIIALLAERAGYVQQIGQLKRNDEEVVAQDRQQVVYQTRRNWAEAAGISADFVEQFYRLLIAHNIELERQQLQQRRDAAPPATTER